MARQRQSPSANGTPQARTAEQALEMIRGLPPDERVRLWRLFVLPDLERLLAELDALSVESAQRHITQLADLARHFYGKLSRRNEENAERDAEIVRQRDEGAKWSVIAQRFRMTEAAARKVYRRARGC